MRTFTANEALIWMVAALFVGGVVTSSVIMLYKWLE